MNEFDYIARAAKKMEKERYKEVIDLCSKAININSQAVEAFNFRANAKYELGEYNEAIEDFAKTIELEPKTAKHYYNRCWAYIKLGDFESAIIDINSAIELSKNNPVYYFDRAHINSNLARFQEAIIDYTKSIEIEPNEAKYLDRGELYTNMEMYNLAVNDFNTAININPSSVDGYSQRASLYFTLELYDEAIRDFDKALSINSCLDDVYMERGKAKVELGLKEGLKDFDKAIKLAPEDDDYYMFRIIARCKIIQRQSNLKAIPKGLPLEDEFFKIFNEKQAKQDLRDLNKVLKISPRHNGALELRMERYYYLESYKKAFKDCNLLIKLCPENEDYYLRRSTIAFRLGKYQLAIDDSLKFVSMNDGKNNNHTRFIKALSEYKLKQYNNVMETLKEVLPEEDAYGLYYYRALAKYNMKNFIGAIKDFAKAIALKPDVAEIYEDKMPSLINIFLRNNKKSETPIGLSGIKK